MSLFIPNFWDSPLRVAREVEFRHLCKCRKTYKQVVENKLLDPDGGFDPHHHAKELWAEGTNTKVLISGCFEQFLGFLRETHGYGVWSTDPYYKLSRGSRWGDTSNRHGQWFRKGPGYTRLPHHEPKGEPPKAAWRKHKRFDKDKGRAPYRRHHNAGPWGKRQVHSANRQHTRRMIDHERFDEISQNVQDVVRCWWD